MKYQVPFVKALLLSILLGGGALTCSNTLAQTTALESIARQRIAQRHNLPIERLTMIYSTTSTYRLSNQTAYSFKALDNEAATIYTITLDVERAASRALLRDCGFCSIWERHIQNPSGSDRLSKRRITHRVI